MDVQHLHEQRGVKFEELIVLLGVRNALATELITFADGKSSARGDMHTFNMKVPGNKNLECGSVGCIGGYMALGMNKPMRNYVHHNCSLTLRPLFFPNLPFGVNWESITPFQAVRAIDNWLDTGNPKWDEVVGLV